LICISLAVSAHSLSLKIRFKVLLLDADLPAITYLEPGEIAPVDKPANCFFRYL